MPLISKMKLNRLIGTLDDVPGGDLAMLLLSMSLRPNAAIMGSGKYARDRHSSAT